MCEFHGSNVNGFGDIWWTDKLIYFSSIDGEYRKIKETYVDVFPVEVTLVNKYYV